MKSKREAEQLWKEESPRAFEFRDELLHTFCYAYRKIPSFLAIVATINKLYISWIENPQEQGLYR